MSSYCTAADLHSYGLPRNALTNPGRLVPPGGVDAAADAITLDLHGFVAGDPVSFRAEAGGALPAPLAAGVTYYAQPVDQARFQVAATAGGAAIDLTTAGARITVIAPLPVAAAISWASALIDDMLPAHLVPLTAPYPEIVTATAAELAAGKLLTGSSSESLMAMVDAAMKRLARWGKGVPIRGENAPAGRANLAQSTATPRRDRRGWSRFGGIE